MRPPLAHIVDRKGRSHLVSINDVTATTADADGVTIYQGKLGHSHYIECDSKSVVDAILGYTQEQTLLMRQLLKELAEANRARGDLELVAMKAESFLWTTEHWMPGKEAT